MIAEQRKARRRTSDLKPLIIAFQELQSYSSLPLLTTTHPHLTVNPGELCVDGEQLKELEKSAQVFLDNITSAKQSLSMSIHKMSTALDHRPLNSSPPTASLLAEVLKSAAVMLTYVTGTAVPFFVGVLNSFCKPFKEQVEKCLEAASVTEAAQHILGTSTLPITSDPRSLLALQKFFLSFLSLTAPPVQHSKKQKQPPQKRQRSPLPSMQSTIVDIHEVYPRDSALLSRHSSARTLSTESVTSMAENSGLRLYNEELSGVVEYSDDLLGNYPGKEEGSYRARSTSEPVVSSSPRLRHDPAVVEDYLLRQVNLDVALRQLNQNISFSNSQKTTQFLSSTSTGTGSVEGPPSSPWVFQLLSRGDRFTVELKSAVASLGGIFSQERKKLLESCTHVVVERGAEGVGELYLSACAAGVLMVHPDYVEESKKAKQWLATREHLLHFDVNPTRPIRYFPGILFQPWRVLLFSSSGDRISGVTRVLLAGGCTSVRWGLVDVPSKGASPRRVHLSGAIGGNQELLDATAGEFLAAAKHAAGAVEPEFLVNSSEGRLLLADATHILIEPEQSAHHSDDKGGFFYLPLWVPPKLCTESGWAEKVFSMDIIYHCLCERSVGVEGGIVFNEKGALVPGALAGGKCRFSIPDLQ